MARVEILGFRVQDLGFKVQGPGVEGKDLKACARKSGP